MGIVLAKEQELALDLIESGANVFLTGDAGTGKSTVINEFRSRNSSNVAFLSPTGIAALNIGGSTIHRFFKFPLGFLNAHSISQKAIKPEVKDILKVTKTIVIDEISMVRADMMQAIDLVLRKAAKGEDHRLPFGGKQLIVVGDFYQLPPVTQKSEETHFQNLYGGPYSFNAIAWQNADFRPFHLKTVHRQSKDIEFLYALNRIKSGDISAIPYFNSRLGAIDTTGGISLCSINRTVDQLNKERLRELEGNSVIFKGKSSGNIKASDRPTEENLSLKIGAKVMMIANDEDGEYVNGSTGFIKNIKRGRGVDVELDDGNIVFVEPRLWEVMTYVLDESGENLEQEILGQFTQLPIKLAWAVSIHKAQGQTLDSATLDLGWGAFAHGQLYVGLSRVRSLQDLYLRQAIRPRDVIVDPRVCQFMKQCNEQDCNPVGASYAI